MSASAETIKRSIAQHMRYAVERLNQAQTFIGQQVPDDLMELSDHKNELLSFADKIQKSCDNIKARDEQWQTLLANLKTDPLADENLKEYEKTAEGEGGYLGKLISLEDAIMEIIKRVRSIEYKMHLKERSLPPQAPQPYHSHDPNAIPGKGSPRGHAAEASNRTFAAKPPKIPLPTFSGKILEWKQFWSIFQSNIHSRNDLTAVEKFTYLLAQLKGEAKESIAGMIIDEENYDEAVEILHTLYDRDEERLTTMLYGEFKKLQPSGKSREEKRKTFNACERIFRQLKTAGEDLDTNSCATMDLLSKFPDHMIKDLTRYYKITVKSPLSEVRKAIAENLAEQDQTYGMLDDLQSMRNSKSGAERKEGKQFSNEKSDQPNTTFTTFSRNLKPVPKKPCYLCNETHFNSDCHKYPSAQQRISRLKTLKRCFRCMLKHDPDSCNSQIRCAVCKTSGDHITPLCPTRYPSKPVKGKDSKPWNPGAKPFRGSDQSTGVSAQPLSSGTNLIGQQTSGSTQPNVNCMTNASHKHSLFQTAKVQICNLHTNEKKVARLCLDTLSNRSYITERLANDLNLISEGAEKLFVSVFGATKHVNVPTHVVSFGVLQKNGNVKHIQANTTRVISDIGVIPKSWPMAENQLIRSLQSKNFLADDYNDPNDSVDILIGADYAWDFLIGPKIPTNTKIQLIPSTLGFMLAGQIGTESFPSQQRATTMLVLTESSCSYPSELSLIASGTKLESSYPDVDEFWKLETVGICDDPLVNDDAVALKRFEDTVYFEKGRYQVQWPWIEERKPFLPSNFEVALRRLKTLPSRFVKNPEILDAYNKTLKLQLERGIIEKVPDSEVHTAETVHYLPHHPVVQPKSTTTKVRIVYDASSKSRPLDYSLNQCLYRGPIMLPDLCHCLMRFRTHEVAIVGDIEKAFLQVSVQPQDRDVTRFLWLRDPSLNTVENNIDIYRFTRVAFGVISSPFLLAATIRYHLTSENSQFAKKLIDDVYVDNLITGFDAQEDSVAFYRQCKDIFQKAGMNIYEFCSNSPVLMGALPDQDRMGKADATVLGVKWDSQSHDSLSIPASAKWISNADGSTKRRMLRAIAAVYDPLGFFQPILLEAKVILQKLWENDLPWDESINEHFREQWKVVYSSISKIFDFQIPRFIGSISSGSEFIIFSDASQKAYAMTVYLRIPSPDGGFVCNLIYARSRLAPLSTAKAKTQVTLPRLELLGAFIAALGGNFCREAFKLNLKIYFFTDSEIVLHWLRSTQELKRFVARRVEVLRKVDNCEFGYVKSQDNPADFSTRGKSFDDLVSNDLWWHGPSWLAFPSEQWPQHNLPSISDEALRQIQAEQKPVPLNQTLVAGAELLNLCSFLDIDLTRFSRLQKLLRVTVICLKFVKVVVWQRLSQQTQNRFQSLAMLFEPLNLSSLLTAEEFAVAKAVWTRACQRNHFQAEIEAIHKGKPLSRAKQLSIQIDNHGILRSCSRFANADLPDEVKYPKMLPHKCLFTNLVINFVHCENLHAGVSQTLNQLRSEFWVIRGRATVKKVLNKCKLCLRYKRATPFALPQMPPWPKERVVRSFPFQFVGVDYFGPVRVSVNGIPQKMWVALFSCLTTRAIHLELVIDCSSKEFLKALIRLVSRRGCPEQIISDNAAYFRLVKILADKAWKHQPQDPDLLSYISQNGIKWKFIIELAPWQGGHYERLVGVVKSVMKTVIGRKLLSWSDFVTVLAETEAAVNSRPITYVSSDSESRALRPIDFQSGLPHGVDQNTDPLNLRDFGETGRQLVSIWKQRTRHLDQLWKTWYSEYLHSLRESTRSFHRSGRSDHSDSPVVGQIVLLADKDLPRGSWKLARVTNLVRSQDGLVRAAQIRLPNGIEIRRAVNFLLPLEVPSPEEISVNHSELPKINTPDDPEETGDFLGYDTKDVEEIRQRIQQFYPSDSGSDTD